MEEDHVTWLPIVTLSWIPKLIKRVKYVSNKVYHIVDFCLNSVMEGYIIEYFVGAYSVIQYNLKGFI